MNFDECSKKSSTISARLSVACNCKSQTGKVSEETRSCDNKIFTLLKQIVALLELSKFPRFNHNFAKSMLTSVLKCRVVFIESLSCFFLKDENQITGLKLLL